MENEDDDDEDEEDEEDSEESENENDKKVNEKHIKESSESLEEIEDDDDEEGDDEESDDLINPSSDNKNALFVVELKDVPPSNLKVVDLNPEDDQRKTETPNTTASSSFISTSSESESE